MATNLRGFWKDPNPQPEPVAKAKPKKKQSQARKDRKKLKRRLRDKAKLAQAGVKSLGAPHPDYKSGDDSFYRSREWRTLRYAAIKNCGGGCMCCGAKASDGAQLQGDHIIPRYKAPHLSLDINNVQVLCQDCNIGKGAWDDTNWKQHFKSITP